MSSSSVSGRKCITELDLLNTAKSENNALALAKERFKTDRRISSIVGEAFLPNHIGASVDYYLGKPSQIRKYTDFRKCFSSCINDPRISGIKHELTLFITELGRLERCRGGGGYDISSFLEIIFIRSFSEKNLVCDWEKKSFQSLRALADPKDGDLFKFLNDVVHRSIRNNQNPSVVLQEFASYLKIQTIIEKDGNLFRFLGDVAHRSISNDQNPSVVLQTFASDLKIQTIKAYAQTWTRGISNAFDVRQKESRLYLNYRLARLNHAKDTLNFYKSKVNQGEYPEEGVDFNWVHDNLSKSAMEVGYKFAKKHQAEFSNPNDIWNLLLDFDDQAIPLPTGKTPQDMIELEKKLESELASRGLQEGNSVNYLAYWLPRMADWRNLVKEHLEFSYQELGCSLESFS